MFGHYYSRSNSGDLINLSDRPMMGRPIVGSNARNQWSTTELNSPSNDNLFQTIGRSNSSDADSCDSYTSTTTRVSPFGSPHKYSPLVWPNYVHSSAIPDNSNDSKSDFDSNGRVVPINGTSCGGSVETSRAVNQYEMFGRNGFNFADLKPSVGQKPSKELYSQKVNRKRFAKTQVFCQFCKNNNETPEVYNSHILKDPFGKTLCPVLRKYDCPLCRSGGGDYAHTIRYCPLNRPDVNGCPPLPSVIKMLKNSRSADGKKRLLLQ